MSKKVIVLILLTSISFSLLPSGQVLAIQKLGIGDKWQYETDDGNVVNETVLQVVPYYFGETTINIAEVETSRLSLTSFFFSFSDSSPNDEVRISVRAPSYTSLLLLTQTGGLPLFDKFTFEGSIDIQISPNESFNQSLIHSNDSDLSDISIHVPISSSDYEIQYYLNGDPTKPLTTAEAETLNKVIELIPASDELPRITIQELGVLTTLHSLSDPIKNFSYSIMEFSFAIRREGQYILEVKQLFNERIAYFNLAHVDAGSALFKKTIEPLPSIQYTWDSEHGLPIFIRQIEPVLVKTGKPLLHEGTDIRYVVKEYRLITKEKQQAFLTISFSFFFLLFPLLATSRKILPKIRYTQN